MAAVGVTHHLAQRGNSRQSTFFDDDRLAYCRLLDEQCSREGVRLLGYCLKTNHVHLAAIPERPESFARGLDLSCSRLSSPTFPTFSRNVLPGFSGPVFSGDPTPNPVPDISASTVVFRLRIATPLQPHKRA